MGYRFVFGPSGAGKSSALRKEILERAGADLKRLDFSNYLYIVPEQFTMQTQKDLVLDGDTPGIMNVDVLSFGRLTHRIFEEVGEREPQVMDDTGKSLIVRRLASRCRSRLKVLGRRADAPGMIDEIKSMISEFMQYAVTPEMVGELAAFAGERGQGSLRVRLEDLQVLYEAFLAYREGRFATGEDVLQILARDVEKSDLIKNAVLVFDGFTGFTPIQYLVLEALMVHAREVVFSMTIGEDGGPSGEEVLDPETVIDQAQLFYLTRKTIREIALRAKRLHVPHGEDLDLGGGEKSGRFLANPALAHLERRILRFDSRPYAGETEAVRILEAANPAAEADRVCTAIRELVRRGYAYRDIGIVCADLTAYADEMERAAVLYDLPVYIDRTRNVGRNPLTEAVLAGLETVEKGMERESVFRFLKSGLSLLGAEEISRFENACIARGITGRRRFQTILSDDCEASRKELLRELEPLFAAAGTAGERVRGLYAFLTGFSAQDQMEQRAQAFHEQGDFERETQYRQLYPAFMDLLDQIDALLGDEPISRKDFLDLIRTGIGEIQLGTLPQKVDRILVGDLERTRLSELKALFVMGVNDAYIPKAVSAAGIVSDLDREFLDESDIELAPTPRELLYQQRLYLYLALTKPKDRLFLSLSRTDAAGRALRPSYLVRDIRRLFPGMARDAGEGQGSMGLICGTKDGLRRISESLARFAQDEMPEKDPAEENAFLSVYRLLASGDAATRQRLFRLRDAAFLYYRPEPLSERSARALYGTLLSGSVSRLESAAQCYLRQFLAYGLRLQERKSASFRPADYGTILHACIERFGRRVLERGLTFDEVAGKERDALLHEVLMETFALYAGDHEPEDPRMGFRLRRIEEELGVTVEALQYQVSRGSFAPSDLELRFGDDGSFGFDLPSGRRVSLSGQIDRVDKARDGGRVYVKIIDYKSSQKKLDMEQIERGLQIQLPLYMDIALKEEERKGSDALPAAMLYNRFEDPVFTGGDALWEDGNLTREELLAELLKKRRAKLAPKGLVSADGRAIALLDREQGAEPAVIPVRRKKDGGFTSASSVFDEELYRRIIETVHQRIIDLSEDILSGSIEACPVRTGRNTTACTYCSFAGSCPFDRGKPGYHYS